MMKYFFLVLFFIAASPGIAFSQQIPSSNKAVLVSIIKKSKLISDQLSPGVPDMPQDLPVTYTFNGNGNWNEASNWENNLMPPPTTNNGSEIIINNIPGGECLLNIPYTVTPGTSLSILSGKTLKLPANLIIN